ncbi:hypothetical protein ACIBG8_14410 [Nonomuraea sp. NPDC050556]|uniref:hypothetical protein n=1 Tax=Nonomuraea sp. NPDC050556 TaxID=3364369 RepID=UPI0037B13048
MNDREEQQRMEDDPEVKTGYGRPYENDATFVAGEHGTTHVTNEPGNVLDDEADETTVHAVPGQDEYVTNDVTPHDETIRDDDLQDEDDDLQDEAARDEDLQDEAFQDAGVRDEAFQEAADHQAAPLFDQDPAELQERWRDLQWAFVDEPRQTVERAGGLVEEVVTSLTSALSTRTSEMRDRWKNTAENDTEQLRLALREYRDVLERLLTLHGGKES